MVMQTPIRHVIVLDLKDPADYREFGSDCFQLLFVPGVRNVLTGPGLETHQSEEMSCGAAAVLDMDTAEACVALPHQAGYTALLDKWRPRANSLRVTSFGPRCEITPETIPSGTPPASNARPTSRP